MAKKFEGTESLGREPQEVRPLMPSPERVITTSQGQYVISSKKRPVVNDDAKVWRQEQEEARGNIQHY